MGVRAVSRTVMTNPVLANWVRHRLTVDRSPSPPELRADGLAYRHADGVVTQPPALELRRKTL